MCQHPKIGTCTEKSEDMFWSHCQEAATPALALDSRALVLTRCSHVCLQRQRGKGGVQCLEVTLHAWSLETASAQSGQVGCAMTDWGADGGPEGRGSIL